MGGAAEEPDPTGSHRLVSGQVYAKHVPINANKLGSLRVSSPGVGLGVCLQGGGYSPRFSGAGLRYFVTLLFWDRRTEAAGLQGAGDDVSPANP